MSRERFEAIVARIIEYIYAGDAFQVVPSQRWSAPVPVEAFSIYRGLRAVNPSPYMYFLDFGDFEIAGASPEPLITVSRAARDDAADRRHAAARRRPPTRTARIADELLADEKERAEHVMLVDLGRNDLGRVCEYGSVQVESFMAVENYCHVMHIVSSVAGQAARRHRRARRAALGAAGGHAVGRAEGARDADHRRARAGQARRLRRRDRLRSATPATSTPASTSAPSSSRTASPTSRPAAARSPTPSPTTSSASRRRRRRAVLQAIELAGRQDDWD